MPAPATTAELLDMVRKSGILPIETFEKQLAAADPLPEDPIRSATALVKRGVLTSFQAKLILAGKYRGFRLGPYIVLGQLGQGGMGAVYLAEHETLRRQVAIKVLAPTEGVNTLAIERFLREARAAAALDHPNIVRIFDVAKHGQTHYLAMEYIDGKTLDVLLETSGPLKMSWAVELMLQAAAGLHHAYEKGFVHRDIKPGNLIIAKDDTLKILDMGLARSFQIDDQLTANLDNGAVVGTADYISPEQAMNAPGLDIRADIYSLGATFFTLLAGRPPFVGNTTQKLVQHQMKPPPLLSELDETFPEGLAMVVDRMLAKKPADRFQTPAELIEALGPWLPNTPRVVAALSRTNLAHTPGLQNTFAAVVAGSSKRLPRPKPGDFEPVEPPQSRLILGLAIAGGVVGATVFGALIAYLISR